MAKGSAMLWNKMNAYCAIVEWSISIDVVIGGLLISIFQLNKRYRNDCYWFYAVHVQIVAK